MTPEQFAGFVAALPVEERHAALARALRDGRISAEEVEAFNRAATAVAAAIVYGYTVREPASPTLN